LAPAANVAPVRTAIVIVSSSWLLPLVSAIA
jgi:hypothetical protein